MIHPQSGSLPWRMAAFLLLVLTLACTWNRTLATDKPGGSAETTQTATSNISPKIAFDPALGTITGCATAEISIKISDVTDLYGADVLINFDPTLLEVVEILDANDGIANNVLTPPLFIPRKEYNNSTGIVRYVATQLNPTPSFSGSGNLLLIRFRARGTGTIPLSFDYWQLAGTGGIAIPSAIQSGAITTSPPESPTSVDISVLNTTTAKLSWNSIPGIHQYRIYRETHPYQPIETVWQTIPSSTTTANDPSALNDPSENHFYKITTACDNGFESIPANHVGEFEFEIKPFTP